MVKYLYEDFMEKKFSVSGMTCSACSAGIEKTLQRLEGVQDASVSLMGKSMTVVFDPSVIKEDTIIAAVEKLGYGVSPFGAAEKDDAALKLRGRFLVSLIFLLPLMYFSMGGMIGLVVPEMKVNYVIQAALSLIIIGINFKFYTSGVRAVINRSPNMDTLVAMGSFSALAYSIVITIMLFAGSILSDSHAFYEASAMVVTLVTLGKWLEEISKRKTGAEIEKLSSLIPKTASVIRDGREQTVLTGELEEGDIVILRTGDYSPVDGEAVEGYCSLDKSAITGESIPEEVSVGGKVISGSIVRSGYVYVRAEKVGGDTLFAEIVEIVKNAGASKAPVQKLADKIASVFVPVVAVIALLTFIVWLVSYQELYTAFKYGISVLVISCPCALGLATPVAIMAVTGKAASVGVLFKNAESIQKMAGVKCVLLDKTATLTEGKPQVSDFVNYSEYDDNYIKNIVSALERNSNHPLAEAMLAFCGETDCKPDKFDYVLGKGITGEIDGKKFRLGNFSVPPSAEKYVGKTVITLAEEDKLIALFALFDNLKSDSKAAISELNGLGVKTVMITGDNESSAKVIADELGISEYRAGVLPDGKAAEVEKYKKEGYITAFVGDGINDSPALATADVGIAMGTGTDIAIESADAVLAGGSVAAVVDTVKLGKKALNIIKGNLFWAFFYNVVFIPVAAGVFAFANFTITPSIASLCMCVSSLFVVLNALRIRSYKRTANINCGSKGAVMKFKIEGMMCKHCEKKVFDAISSVEGVKSVEINLKKKTAKTEGDSDEAAIISAVVQAGYEAKRID